MYWRTNIPTRAFSPSVHFLILLKFYVVKCVWWNTNLHLPKFDCWLAQAWPENVALFYSVSERRKIIIHTTFQWYYNTKSLNRVCRLCDLEMSWEWISIFIQSYYRMWWCRSPDLKTNHIPGENCLVSRSLIFVFKLNNDSVEKIYQIRQESLTIHKRLCVRPYSTQN